ncbi:MAG: DHH family phosphoesterase [Thermodesulfobacteriota bacterium]
MTQDQKRYLFIGDFDSLLIGLFSKRGEVIWVSSSEEALNQTGIFTLIIMDNKVYTPEITTDLGLHYPTSPLIISNGKNKKDNSNSVRYVKFDEIINSQLVSQERLARTELKINELRKVHENAKQLLILVHDNPDPDCIASALALRTLLKRNKQTAIIGHLGEEVSRPENVAMIELLDIDLNVLSIDDIKDFDSIAMVDVQPPFFGDAVIEVDSVIDHHPQVAIYDAKFTEIGPDEGATSTIMTSYLRAAQVEISERLSTALLYGIKTDTVTLNRDANPGDIEAFTYLYPQANLGLLRKIEKAEIPGKEVKCFGKALADHWINSDIFFVNLGRIDREYLIPKMADFGMQVKGMEWSVAFGIVSKKHLVISVRNVGHVKSAGRVVSDLFKEIGSAGGHRSSSKAVIPLNKVRKEIGKASQEHIEKWVTKLFINAVTEKVETENSVKAKA